jgi:peptidoglycan hydrolase CwlO-like protein
MPNKEKRIFRYSRLTDFSHVVMDWMGSVSSLLVHTVLFLSSLSLILLGVAADKVLLILTTLVSLEAIYMAIFIQMAVNRNSQSLEEVEENIDEIQEDVEEIQKDVDEIEKDVDEIQKDVDEIQEDVEEIQKDVDEIEKDVDEIQKDVDEIQEDVEEIEKEDTETEKQDKLNVEVLLKIEAQLKDLMIEINKIKNVKR